MIVDLLAIGNEVLYGEISDSNTPHLARRLFEEGYKVGRHVCVGDDIDAIAGAILNSLESGSSVVCTGGLGPTPDDLTREALAKVAGVPLVRSAELEERVSNIFRARGIPMPEANLKQADLPKGARYIPQKLGTAPGIILDWDGLGIYALPGVPHEMREMFERGVLPDLESRRSGKIATAVKTFKVWGASEAAVAEILESIEGVSSHYDSLAPVSISYLPTLSELKVRIVARGADTTEAKRLLEPVAREVAHRLGELVFGEDSDTLPAVLGAILVDKGLSLAAAESITGGMVGQRITTVPGASKWFKGSAVTYMKETKTSVLGIDPSVLEVNGVVSARCAEEMAIAACRLFSSDVGISCTGEAGPKADEAEVGQVYLGVALKGQVRSIGIRLHGDRERIREYTTTSLLNLARRTLSSSGMQSL